MIKPSDFFAERVNWAGRHIEKIKLLRENERFFVNGIMVSLKDAVKKRRFCMRQCNLFLRKGL